MSIEVAAEAIYRVVATQVHSLSAPTQWGDLPETGRDRYRRMASAALAASSPATSSIEMLPKGDGCQCADCRAERGDTQFAEFMESVPSSSVTTPNSG